MNTKTQLELVNITPPKDEPTMLELDPKHPGINDQNYIQRRKLFFDLSREYRLGRKGIPNIEYTDEENRIWRHVSTKLQEIQQQKACSIYLDGIRALNLEVDSIPDFIALNEKLHKQHRFQLTPAEGLIDVRNFFAYLSHRIMPCTQFMRHGANPEYTPEPDAVHDVIGHIPPLMDQEYVELIQLIGEGVAKAKDHQLLAWERFYWFTIEFGLIQEGAELKAFGAGLLSSYGELMYCFSDAVDRRDFDLQEVINQDYDPTKMQSTIFVIQSIQQLKQAVLQLIDQI